MKLKEKLLSILGRKQAKDPVQALKEQFPLTCEVVKSENDSNTKYCSGALTLRHNLKSKVKLEINWMYTEGWINVEKNGWYLTTFDVKADKDLTECVNGEKVTFSIKK